MNSLAVENGKYETGENRSTWCGRLFPSLVCYARMTPIVFGASRKARLGTYTHREWENSSLAIIAAFESVGASFQVSGIENIAAQEGPCVFVGNHMSTLETFALPSFILPHKKTTFVIKRSLVEYPVFKHVMRFCDPIVVGRTNPREDFKIVMSEGEKRLQDAISVVVFPQTTRSTVFDPANFNTIGIKLAKRAGVPVIPVAIKTDAWGNGKWVKEFGPIDPGKKIHIAFGTSMTIASKGQEEHGAVLSFIEKHLHEWQT
ncbi:lysophospholipid acyltransferase family protein [Thermodesulfobacteriota bacterium]